MTDQGDGCLRLEWLWQFVKIRLFLLLEHLRDHCRVINWPKYNIVMSQDIGRPEGSVWGERQENGWLVKSEHTRSFITFATFIH